MQTVQYGRTICTCKNLLNTVVQHGQCAIGTNRPHSVRTSHHAEPTILIVFPPHQQRNANPIQEPNPIQEADPTQPNPTQSTIMRLVVRRRYACSVVFSLGSVGCCNAFARPTRLFQSASASTLSKTVTFGVAGPDHNELPPDFPRRDDVLIALEAVRKAGAVTNALQPDNAGGIDSVSKSDLSPVTVADFAAQAIVLRHIKEAFADDSFIAEESSSPLTDDAALAQSVSDASGMSDIDMLKSSIDLGKEYELWHGDSPDSENAGMARPPRVWCLDPIDGTKGFLRGRKEGGQYCVALALLEDGEPTIGVMGCPNLPASATDFSYAWTDDETLENNRDSRGCIFVASKGGGCYQLPFVPGTLPVKIQVSSNDGSDMQPSDGRFCIGEYSIVTFSSMCGHPWIRVVPDRSCPRQSFAVVLDCRSPSHTLTTLLSK